MVIVFFKVVKLLPSINVFYEPTDRRKALKCLQSQNGVTFSSPNLIELRTMAQFVAPNTKIEATLDLNEVSNLCKIVSTHITFLIVTMGCKGVFTVNNFNKNFLKKKHSLPHFYPVDVVNNVQNVSGAGDCFASGFIYGILSNRKESDCVSIGFNAARVALSSKKAVPEDLSNEKFY